LNIILLGLVSLLTDASSEMLMPILPLYITSVGGGVLAIGLIGGLGDGVSSLLQVFMGFWSDLRRRRKPFVFAGYALSSTFKLLLAFSITWAQILFFRVFERAGKGIRSAPRDAIIADSSVKNVRGRAFGIHRSLDTAGAIIGSFLAFVFFWFLGWDFRPILIIAAALGFTALIPIFFVEDKDNTSKRFSLTIKLKELPRNLKAFIAVSTVFSLANFTYMLFILRAQNFFTDVVDSRMALAIPILLYVLFNAVYAVLSVPSGIISDRIGRRKVLFIGYGLYGVTCLGFVFADNLAFFSVLFALYGTSNALFEGTQRAFASDLAYQDVRGTVLGTMNTLRGLATIPASAFAGLLWEMFGPSSTFIYGSVLGFSAALLLLTVGRR
jgi:MFS family permease